MGLTLSHINVHALPALTDNYIYAITTNDSCVVVDPGESQPVHTFLKNKGLSLTHILCTHHHADHVNGVSDLLQTYPAAEVWTSTYDISRIAQATRGVSEGESLQLFGERLQILAMPGHTLGQIAYWLPEQEALFVGDTLFSCGCGRLFEGRAEQMFASLRKIATLPKSTKIYFGHEYTLRNIDFVIAQRGETPDLKAYRKHCVDQLTHQLTTTPASLDLELKINPFLLAKSVTEFSAWREARNNW